MGRLKLPLGSEAVKAADEALQEAHPELGGRKLTMSPEDADLRKEWMDAYRAASGQGDGGLADTPPLSPVAPCGDKGAKKPNPAEESKATGNRIDIVFDPDKSKKVKSCDKIVHVQFVRKRVDGKMIKPGDYSSHWKYRDGVTTKKGWGVDHLATETTPDYQQGTGDGKKDKSGSAKATMADAPTANGGDGAYEFYDPKANPKGVKKYTNEFATFAYCMQGDDCGKWYEGVTWRYTKTWTDNRDGNPGVSKFTDKRVTSGPTKNQLAALDLFNKNKGFTPCEKP